MRVLPAERPELFVRGEWTKEDHSNEYGNDKKKGHANSPNHFPPERRKHLSGISYFHDSWEPRFLVIGKTNLETGGEVIVCWMT